VVGLDKAPAVPAPAFVAPAAHPTRAGWYDLGFVIGLSTTQAKATPAL
jgi:hypothetical protein